MLASFLSRFSNNVLLGVGVRVRVRVRVQRNLKGKIKCTTISPWWQYWTSLWFHALFFLRGGGGCAEYSPPPQKKKQTAKELPKFFV